MQDIYDPLKSYAEEFREKFQSVAAETFRGLVEDSGIDIAANKVTVKALYETEDRLSKVSSALSRWRLVRIILLLVAVAGLLLPVLTANANDWDFGRISDGAAKFLLATMAAAAIAAPVIVFCLNDKIKFLSGEKENLEKKVTALKQEAWRQLEPLNKLYDWDLTLRMISKTVPKLEFDPFFTHQRVLDLEKIYKWDSSFNETRSVIYANSGLINGNPFVFCKTRKMEWGTKVYTGTKTIHWTTLERDSSGKLCTRHHSQTLVAELEKPFPEFLTGTRLIYGNTAAPDLKFKRKKSGYADGGIGAWFKKRELRRFSRNLDDDSEYTMMQNEEFEVAFETKNRNDERQFRLLFTPLAQRSMLSLLKDKVFGYGDDFDFEKNEMINCIIAEHLSAMDLETNPKRYRHYDFDEAKRIFFKFNQEYFRSIYFAFAPLLCVPLYQQMRSCEDIYGKEWADRASFWEHESLANFWGQKYFKHPDCVTESILKTEEISRGNGESLVKVFAHGFRKERRLTYVQKWGLDGSLHDVPVYWDEYLPVCGTGTFSAAEDPDAARQAYSPNGRAEHIAQKIRDFAQDGNGIYRRNMISRL
ncbi:MAG: hypothetical protein K6B46_05535 [Opitutales bacterium]|nr:hypothetical protein [Opitutales bacterium]